jgi:tripartite-type tricarboxylate transporter receptor subunit TctC
MSPALVNKLNADLISVMKLPQISEKINQQGMLEVASTPAYFSKKIVSDVQMYKDIIQKSGAKTD